MLGEVAHTFNLGNWEVEAGASLREFEASLVSRDSKGYKEKPYLGRQKSKTKTPKTTTTFTGLKISKVWEKNPLFVVV